MTARKAPADFGGAAAARRRRPAASATPAVTATPGPLPISTGAQRKYTVLMDDAVADAFDERLLLIRRQVGRRVDKSHVVRELVALLDEDPGLMTTVVDRLKLRSV